MELLYTSICLQFAFNLPSICVGFIWTVAPLPCPLAPLLVPFEVNCTSIMYEFYASLCQLSTMGKEYYQEMSDKMDK